MLELTAQGERMISLMISTKRVDFQGWIS